MAFLSFFFQKKQLVTAKTSKNEEDNLFFLKSE